MRAPEFKTSHLGLPHDRNGTLLHIYDLRLLATELVGRRVYIANAPTDRSANGNLDTPTLIPNASLLSRREFDSKCVRNVENPGTWH